ncbi:ER membrane protein complex subunit 7 [Thrips palmi]|uniref:ER membrane protein complex subunit 7 n=1 Tax=Thrips palmi TaxID=161013 RepID=A0A6P8YB51_THRPL|nr:ER membrane protein complex subunit 7 [Thrips palmi]
MKFFYAICVVLNLHLLHCLTFAQRDLEPNQDVYTIEGRVFPPDGPISANSWYSQTRILANGGEFVGILKRDNSFIIHNVPTGSYVVEVVNPSYAYEPVRVEINSKGKLRARKVNYIQTSTVEPVVYPLAMTPVTRYRYFQVREQWRATDFLYSPMVLMMVLPLVIIMILPKVMNDPETRKEMEHLNSLTRYDMPEMSEVLTSFFGGEKPKVKSARKKKAQ